MIKITEEEIQQIRGIAYKVYERSFPGIEFEDLFQEGLLAYVTMKEKYDKEKNDYFMGFAYKRIYGAMLDWIAKNSLNKSAAVRKNVDGDKYLITATPENYEALHYDYGNQQEFIYQEELKTYISEFICGLTPYEQRVLYHILYEGINVKDLEKEVGIRLDKTKIILTKILEKLKEFLVKKGVIDDPDTN
jgi:RNA polymerase sigma factor (sigma-70 family)